MIPLHDEWIPYLEKGLAQAQALEDGPAAAELNLHLGYLLQLRNKHQGAHACFSASATTFAAVGDTEKLARALNRLAFPCRLQPALGDPVALAQRALTLLSPAHPERAASYVALGWHAYDHRDWSSAAAYFEHALTIAQRQGHPRQIARRLRDLASAWQMQGKYQAAIDCYEQAITRFAAINDGYDQAVAHMNVGVAYLALQEAQAALDWFALAEPIFVRVQDRLHLAMLYNNRGIALRLLGQWTEAETAFLHSITLNEQIATAGTDRRIVTCGCADCIHRLISFLCNYQARS
jgi:tetratricopeptide (TPR) repeat protein